MTAVSTAILLASAASLSACGSSDATAKAGSTLGSTTTSADTKATVAEMRREFALKQYQDRMRAGQLDAQRARQQACARDQQLSLSVGGGGQMDAGC